MARYLRQPKTGAIYVYTEKLAERPDMVDVDEAEAQEAIKNGDTSAKPPVKATPEDVNRVALIAEGIATLDTGTDFTQGGKPKIEALEAATELEGITSAERDQAWDEFSRGQT